MKVSKKLTRSIIFLALMTVSGTTKYLPWRLGVRFGGMLGEIAFYLLRRERGRSLEGLRLAFGQDKSEKELNKIARRNFQNLGKGLIEILNFRYLTPRRIKSLITIEGEEYLKAAEANGKGTVLITGHIGNWELMAAALSLKSYRLNVIAAPLYDPRIDALIIRLRSRFNIETISRGSPSSSKKILNVLKKKEILGLLIDQDTQVNGVFVNFFNQKAYTPAGAAQLALKSNAATITCFVTRLPDDRHKITINKPITLVRSDDNKKDIEVNTAIFTAKIEEHIKLYPEQWVWMHRRWKTQPPPNKG
ncbi:MAG: lysophospholipid acyltransferase family protein [Nitrospiria bacterium]